MGAIMKRLIMASVVGLISVSALFGQTSRAADSSNIVRTSLSPTEADRIIRKFTDNESQFRDALTNYVFNRSATIQTVGLGGQITGTYRRDSFLTFTSSGERFERVTFSPPSTLTELSVTPEDIEDLSGVNPFALEPSALPQYNINFVGKEKIDELTLFVFDVTPKVIPNPKKSKQRLFTGRIWVDDRDLMIVKSKGKAVPETKDSKFPVVETWRENIDGKYWFPSFISADDNLVFGNGNVVHLRMKVRFTNYKVGRTDVKVLEETDVIVEEEPTPKKP
ncbi:MAG TPA: hypothetical protein DEA22_00615 [Blastocatellia bacterium]|nr:hypothetical protein [Blastocatellia bacterium]